MAAIDYAALILELSARIESLRVERAEAVAWRISRAQRVEAWGLNTPQGQQSQAEVVQADARIAAIDRETTTLEGELQTAKEARDAINTATAAAVAAGLTPEAARAKAEADFARATGTKRFLTYTGIALAIVLLIIGGIWAWRKYKKK